VTDTAMAEISVQALIRHQNQRSRYTGPTPTPNATRKVISTLIESAASASTAAAASDTATTTRESRTSRRSGAAGSRNRR